MSVRYLSLYSFTQITIVSAKTESKSNAKVLVGPDSPNMFRSDVRKKTIKLLMLGWTDADYRK
jgi:hypothetical protein